MLNLSEAEGGPAEKTREAVAVGGEVALAAWRWQEVGGFLLVTSFVLLSVLTKLQFQRPGK